MAGGLPAVPFYAPTYPQPPAPAPSQSAPRPPAKPVARAKAADELPPLVMPTPQELGIPVPKLAVDWAAVRARLDRLGATAFALEQAGPGYRFTCRLPAGHLVEGRGASEAEAVRLALEQAEGRADGK